MDTQRIWYSDDGYLGVSWVYYSWTAVSKSVSELAKIFDCSHDEIWEHIETANVPAGTFPKRGDGELHCYIPDIAV